MQHQSILRVENLHVIRANKPVVHGISFVVKPGEITTLLGANGAGKSSTVMALAGAIACASGQVWLDQTRLDGLSPDRIRRHGVALVPEGHRVLGQLNVDDNLKVAALDPSARATQTQLAQVYHIFPELAGRKTQLAGDLSGGQKQMLAMGQAFMAKPAFMIVDELSLGLAPAVVKRLAQALQSAAQSGIGVLMIEQFAQLALQLATHALVLERGTLVFDGPAAELKRRPDILHGAYLAGG